MLDPQFSEPLQPPRIDLPPHGGGGPAELVDLALGFLLRRYVVILISGLLGGAAGEIFLVARPPTYTAYAKIQIGMPKPQFVQQQGLLPDAPFFEQTQMETQFQIILSRTILAPIVQDLKLAADPEFSSPTSGLIRRVLQVFTRLTSLQPKLDPIETAIATLTDRLTINRVGWSLLIEIGANSRNAEKSALIANAVAVAYSKYQQEVKQQANLTASTWLQERLRELQAETTSAEQAVVDFKQQNAIVSADGKRIDEQNLAELNKRLTDARDQSSVVLAHLTRLESIVGNWNAITSSTTPAYGVENRMYAIAGRFSDELASPILSKLRERYLALSRTEQDLATKYGRDHGVVVDLRNRLRDLGISTFDELQRILEGLRSDYAFAKQHQAEIEKQLNQAVSQTQMANNAEVMLRGLESRATTYHALYDSFLQRYTGTVQEGSYPIVETRLISSASALTTTVKPKPILIFGISLMGGLAFGVGVGLLRDLMRRVFRTRIQVQSVLQMPCIAMVPLVKTSGLKGRKRLSKVSEERTLVYDASLFWRVVDAPFSTFAESIRSINLASQFYLKRPNGVIGFTSALPNEGKSTIAAAVAQLTAKAGFRVIIVDCDLRSPTLSSRLAPSATVGIADVVSGTRALEDAVWRDPETNLFLLPAIKAAPLFSSEMLESEPTKRLVNGLRESFDFVIFDLPPLVPIVDARAAAHLIDCMILVVEWGRTKIEVVRHALDVAPNLQESIIGAVLNKTDMDHIALYDMKHKSMYKKEYYTRSIK
jgi:exopolysaccharide transport family protein